jgi:hypothetical protein
LDWVKSDFHTLLLAAIKSALVFVAFAGIGKIFRTVLCVAKGAGFASLFRIRRLGVVQLRKRNHRAKGEKQQKYYLD